MKKTLSMIMALVLLFGVLSSCAMSGEITELTPEMEEEIKQAFCNYYSSEAVAKEDLSVKLIAEFDDAYAVTVDSHMLIQEYNDILKITNEINKTNITPQPSDYYFERVNNLDFVYDDFAEPIHVVSNGVCYRLPEAYKNGLITDKSLIALYEKNKYYCTVTTEDAFAEDVVRVYVRPSHYDKEYTVEDFNEIGCVKLQDTREENFNRRLTLTLAESSKENVLNAVKILEQNDEFYKVSPAMSYIELFSMPNDPQVKYQWALDKISLPSAWDITTGSSSILVGVVDSGIDASHSDLNKYIE